MLEAVSVFFPGACFSSFLQLLHFQIFRALQYLSRRKHRVPTETTDLLLFAATCLKCSVLTCIEECYFLFKLGQYNGEQDLVPSIAFVCW